MARHKPEYIVSDVVVLCQANTKREPVGRCFRRNLGQCGDQNGINDIKGMCYVAHEALADDAPKLVTQSEVGVLAVDQKCGDAAYLLGQRLGKDGQPSGEPNELVRIQRGSRHTF